MKVKYVCPECNKAQHYSKWDRVNIFIGDLLASLGFIFVIYIILVGPQNPINDIVNLHYEVKASEFDDDMRQTMLNVTDCDGDDTYCFANQFFNHVKDVRYVPSSSYSSDGMYDPLYVYEHGGDCKNTANMFVAHLKTVGVPARVDCSYEEKHCVAVVPYIKYGRYREEKMVVDLTAPVAIRLNDDEEVWDYVEIYKADHNRDMTDRVWSYQI